MSEKETFSNQANNLHRPCVIAPRNLRGASGLTLSAGSIVTMLVLLYILADVVHARAERIIAQAPGTSTSVKKTVLLLFPSQSDLPANMLAVQAIREELSDVTDLKVELYYEYMDINRFPDIAHQQKLFDLYAAKYRSKQVDLVILASEVMLNLWMEQRGDISPDTPVVFYVVDSTHLAGRQFPEDVTGTSGVADYLQSSKWILHARPAVTEIVVVHGVGQADQEYIYPADVLKKELGGQVRVTDLSGLPLAEIKRRVKVLSPSSVVLYELMFEDAAGVRFRPIDVLQELAAVSAVPVISSRDQFIGTGTIGGYMYSIDLQARAATQIGLRILRGEAARDIPIAQNQSNRFIFDHSALQRFGIPLSALPQDSIIKNRQYSVWEFYQLQIIALTACFVILLLLVAFLGVVTRRLNATRLALTCLNTHLETQVQERTAVLSRTNQSLAMEITERKQVEEELANVRITLESAFEQTPVPMVLLSMPDAVLRIVNTACRKILGIMDEPTPVGQRLIDFKPSYQDYDAQGNLTPLAESPLARVVLQEQRTLNQERRIVTKDGTTHWALVSGNPIYNSSSDLIAAHLVFPDITDRKGIEKELLQLNETLEERVAQEVEKNLKHERLLIQQSRLAAMGEMIGNIAHQWRQPLNALGLLLYNIKDAYQFNTLDAEYLDQAVADGRRMVQKMSTTISDFSNFFRPDKEISIFSAMKQIREAIALVESNFLNSNIAIHVDAPLDLNLSGFPNEYSQVLLNLLSNARDAILARNQPFSGRVEIVLTEQNDQGCVSVRDNGGGIPIDILGRIFDPYFSTKESGTGIGLYMSKMIIERNMKGSITARNIEGGAEFIVASPLAKDGPYEPS